MNRKNTPRALCIRSSPLVCLQAGLLILAQVSIAAGPSYGCDGGRSRHLQTLDARAGHTVFSGPEVAREKSPPLWPGSKYTEASRRRALYRALNFIYRTSLNRKNFREYGADYLWCFFTLGASLKDARLSHMALTMGHERAIRWRRENGFLPANADAGTIADLAFGSDAADNLGVRNDELKKTLISAAVRFPARDYLGFDPMVEPPPSDMPDECEYDKTQNARGSKVCSVCKRPLKMKTRYDVWYDALITAYSGDHYGVKLGAHYMDVLKWIKVLRPYRGLENGANEDFYDEVYAVTHVCYTLNNYSFYRLSPALLPEEFAFLKDNLREAVAVKDIDMLGEFMDSLRSLGLTTNDAIIRAGMEYYLSHQNRDGSWGDMDEKDIYDRYHPTWNGIAGLSEYNWHGENLSFPEVRPFLEQLSGHLPSK